MKRLAIALALSFVLLKALPQSTAPDICKCINGSKPVLTCSGKQPRDCKQKVTVSMVNGQCRAELAYCVLCVRRYDTQDGKEYQPKLEWTLSVVGHSASYRFNARRGIDILSLSTPDAEFTRPTPSNGFQSFSWEASGISSAIPHPHSATVVPQPSGGPCEAPATSAIVNTDK